MKILDKLPYFIVAGFAWVVIVSSCANQGMPTGGPKDSIPPVLVGTQPEYKSLNFNGKEVRLTFDEFIIPDQVSEMLVVSPPLEKRVTILTKSKTLIVKFNEELQDSVTYSLDFKNSIVDNNERNPYESLRFSFATGDRLDTLRVAGRVANGFNLNPIENTLVLLHKNLHDSAVYTVKPNYIAKTDEEGLFLFDNIASGKYHLFSFNDLNNDMRYNEGAEEIAFHDTLVIPSAHFHAEADTMASGADSLLIAGHVHFLPQPIYMKQFTEEIFDQYLKKSKRDSRYQATFVFNESVSDSFAIQLVDTVVPDWYVLEPNLKYDSLTMWIADTTLAKRENIRMELSYFQLDSAMQLYVKKDTVDMQFAPKEEDKKKRRRSRDDEEEEGPPPVPQFNWTTNLSSSAFNINEDILLTSPHPIKYIDPAAISVYLTEDTLKKTLPFKFIQDSVAWRTYRIAFPWEGETSYTLEIDSAACINIYGISSKKLSSSFKTRPDDYYGTINLELTNVDGQVLIQLLENKDSEKVLQEKITSENGKVVFEYLPPDKYKIKVIFDSNGDGKWTTGSYQDRSQPERVAYINEVIKIRSNFDTNLNWDLDIAPDFKKDIRDRELEELRRKEAEEKARKESEQKFNTGEQQNNNMFQPGGLSPTRM
ncbi:Ig-like domain-containing protein [Mariniphaga anaerophila]|uniref:Ig-like domain-containing protein n=1 Tax=Mariniphaga anaerophila TaxID=1484053 RepID=A0A1M5BR59_9BACT|nr:Ig-like domain-containing protein [Mariniphaga anaerophila]SHF44870.1 Ig-like domain-containing protein [Mariniphaga anaerophila]